MSDAPANHDEIQAGRAEPASFTFRAHRKLNNDFNPFREAHRTVRYRERET